jgi:hypothetical protein
MLEGQHDRRRVAAALAGPRTRARAVIDAAGDLVDALLAGADRAASDLSLLQVECSIEADALRGDARRGRIPCASRDRTARADAGLCEPPLPACRPSGTRPRLPLRQQPDGHRRTGSQALSKHAGTSAVAQGPDRQPR